MAVPTQHKFFNEKVLGGMIREYIEEKNIVKQFADVKTITEQGNEIQIVIEGDDFEGVAELQPLEEIPNAFYNEETKSFHFTRKGLGYLVSDSQLRGSRDNLAELLKEKLGSAMVKFLQKRMFQAIDAQATLRVPLAPEGLTVDQLIEVNSEVFGEEDGDDEVILLINTKDWNTFRKSGVSKIENEKMYRDDNTIKVIQYVENVRILRSKAVPQGKPVLTKKGAAFLYFQHDEITILEEYIQRKDALDVTARMYTTEGIMYPNHIVQFDGAVVPTP